MLPLRCRLATELDLVKATKVKRSCGADRTVVSIEEQDRVLMRMWDYQAACGYVHPMASKSRGIDYLMVKGKRNAVKRDS